MSGEDARGPAPRRAPSERGGSDPRIAIARRDLQSLSREKTIVLALLIQLFVAAFSSFLVVGLTSLYDPSSVSSGGVEIGVAGETTDALRDAVAAQSGATPVTYDSPTAARSAFQAGEVDALLIGTVQPPPGGGDGTVIHVDAVAPEGSIRTTLIVVQVRESLQTLERQVRQERVAHLDQPPVPLPPSADGSPYYGFTYTVLLPLLLFLPPFISGSVAVDSITEEIERGTLELLRVAPVTMVDVVDGKAIAMIALAPAQAALWLALLAANGIAVANPLVLLVYVTAVATVVVAIGVGLGVLLGRRRPAQLLYSVLTLVVFGALVAMPEHPATTTAKLAVDSAEPITYGHVALFVVLAAVAAFVVRRVVDNTSAESL